MGNQSGGHGPLYPYAINGGLFTAVASNSDPEEVYTHQTEFDEAYPAYLIRKSTDSPTKNIVPISMTLTPSGTAPGGIVHIAVFRDLSDRFDQLTIGEEMEYNSPGLDANATPGFNVYANPDCLDPEADQIQLLDNWEQVAADVSPIQYTFDGRCVLRAVGSVLVYVWSDTTGLTVKPVFAIVEEGTRRD